MVKRCIMIFPEFINIAKIEEIRWKYDPLAKHVRPHITLVFPFQSEIEEYDLKRHIEKVTSDLQPFKLKLRGITGHINNFGNYLFLNLQEGEKEIVQLHKRLYAGILEGFNNGYLKENGYTPHLTVGNLKDKFQFEQAIKITSDFNEVFEARVNKVSVEIIDDNKDSIIEMHVPLLH